jgi:hypothetical protein
LSAVQVPLLAATPAVHDHLSGRSSWKWAIRALALGLEAGISTAATFVATAANVDELPLVAGLLREIGVRHLVVNEMHPEGSARGRTELATEPSLLRDALARARRSAAGGGLQVSFIPATGVGQQQQSVAGWGRLAVTTNAQLKLCNQSELTLGSLAELSDCALDRVLYDLSTDAAASYRDRVDRCRCFDRIYGARAAVTRLCSPASRDSSEQAGSRIGAIAGTASIGLQAPGLDDNHSPAASMTAPAFAYESERNPVGNSPALPGIRHPIPLPARRHRPEERR